MPFSVVSVGDIVADFVFTLPQLPLRPDQHQRASHAVIEPGGAGNFLIAGARLGMQMHALGVMGTDLFGDRLIEIYRQEGVDVRGLVRQRDTATTPVLVLIDHAGQHVFVGGPRQGDEVKPPSLWGEIIGSAQALFVTGFSLSETHLANATLLAIQMARQGNIPIFFDPGPMFGEVPLTLRQQALQDATVLILTEEEADDLLAQMPPPNFQMPPPDLPQRGEERRVVGLRRLLSSQLSLICLKRGARGCHLITAQQAAEHPGYQVTVKDTTAAGDSFASALIYGYLKGWALNEMAAFANAMGAAKVQKVGSGRQVPTAQEVRQVLAQFSVDLPF